MTPITSNNIKNDLLTNPAPLTSTDSSKISNTTPPPVYLGPGYSNLPSVINVVFGPRDLYDSLIASVKAYDIGDREGMVENGLRIAEAPFSLYNAFLQCIWYGLQIAVMAKSLSASVVAMLIPLSITSTAAGLSICALEGVLETFGIIRSVRFFKENYPSILESLIRASAEQDPAKRQEQFNSCLEKILKIDLPASVKAEIEAFIKNKSLLSGEFQEVSKTLLASIEEKIYLHHLQHLRKKNFVISTDKINEIEKYVEKLPRLTAEEKLQRKKQIIATNLDTRKSCLIRRIQHRMTEQLEQQLPELIQNLQSSYPEVRLEAKRKAAELFADLRTQFQKNVLVNAAGLLAVVFTITGLVLGYVACPLLIIITLFVFGGVLAFGRSYLCSGLLESKVWKFEKERCIPHFVKKIFQKAPEKKAEAQKIPDESAAKVDLLKTSKHPVYNTMPSAEIVPWTREIHARRRYAITKPEKRSKKPKRSPPPKLNFTITPQLGLFQFEILPYPVQVPRARQ